MANRNPVSFLSNKYQEFLKDQRNTIKHINKIYLVAWRVNVSAQTVKSGTFTEKVTHLYSI